MNLPPVMSENTSEGVVTAQKASSEDSKEEHPQSQCSPTVDAGADELFDSFMEIANDPQLHDSDHKNDTPDGGETTGSTDEPRQVSTADQCESTDSALDVQVKERKNSQNEQSDQLVPEKTQSSNVPQVETVDSNGRHEEISSSGNDELPDVKSKSVSLDGEPVQGTTELPTAEVTSIPDSNESKMEEFSLTSSDSVMTSEDAKMKELSCEAENPDKSPENKENTAGKVNETVTDVKEQSIDNSAELDNKETYLEKSDVANGKEQDQQKAEVAQRLSKAMEDLVGLEQLLSSVVSEFKVAHNEKTVEEIDEGKEATSFDQQEEKCVNDIDSGSMVSEKNEKDVQEIVPQGSEGEVNSCKESENVVCDASEVKGESNTLELKGDQMEKCVDSVESDKQEIPDDEESQVKKDVLATSDSKVQINEEESTAEKLTDKTAEASVEKSSSADKPDPDVSVGESSQKILNDECWIVAEANLEKSEGEHKPGSDFTNADVLVRGIEITVTDESEISENKSLDSLDTEEEGPSNGNTVLPSTASDEGIESDTASDYGDDDYDGVSDLENVSSSADVCKRKSWCLEINRDRLSSDSSTFSEKDFKEEYHKGDSADGKSVKEDYIRGHLLKMGGTGLTPKNWRKRWFVLRGDNCLYYYKHSKDKVPCGVIILTNYSVSKAPEINKNHCFKLTKGGARTYYMCAGSDSDMKKWMMAMMDAAKVSSTDSNPFNIYEGNVHNVSIPALSIRDPDCHGYLYKQGSNYKIWRRRYFVLKNGFLYYYTDMSNTVALGVVKLLDYTITTGDHSGRKYYFTATSPNKSIRTYYFAAESDMDRTRWLSKLEDSIKKGSSAH